MPVRENQFVPVTIAAPEIPGRVEYDGSGSEQLIIENVLQSCGFHVNFEVSPFGRHLRNFKYGDSANAVMTVPEGFQTGGFISEPYIEYHNALILLSSSEADFRQQGASFPGLNVVTFRYATRILDLQNFDFQDVHELTDQRLHLPMLLRGRVDAIIGDPQVIEAASSSVFREISGSKKDERPLTIAMRFPPTPYHLAFKNRAHRDSFDRCRAQHEYRLSNLSIPN